MFSTIFRTFMEYYAKLHEYEHVYLLIRDRLIIDLITIFSDSQNLCFYWPIVNLVGSDVSVTSYQINVVENVWEWKYTVAENTQVIFLYNYSSIVTLK